MSRDKHGEGLLRKGSHWALVEVDPNKQTIKYKDSLGSCGKVYVDGIKLWLADNLKYRLKVEVDFSGWKFYDCGTTVPQQKNWNDCGVFTLLNIEFSIHDLPLNYTQANVTESSFRKKILLALLNGKIGY